MLSVKETEIPMDELEADIIKTVDYQDNFNLWKASATKIIEREEASAGGRRSPRLSNVSTHSSRLTNKPSVVTQAVYKQI